MKKIYKRTGRQFKIRLGRNRTKITYRAKTSFLRWTASCPREQDRLPCKLGDRWKPNRNRSLRAIRPWQGLRGTMRVSRKSKSMDQLRWMAQHKRAMLEMRILMREAQEEFRLNMTKIAPLRDQIVVELIESEAVTAGGIVIPDSATEKPSQGIVKAVGSGKYTDKGKFIPVAVNVGDRVLFSKAAGQQLKVDGEIIHIFSEDQIIAVVNPR